MTCRRKSGTEPGPIGPLSQSTWPSSVESNSASERSKSVLPDPVGPTIASRSPPHTATDTSRNNQFCDSRANRPILRASSNTLAELIPHDLAFRCWRQNELSDEQAQRDMAVQQESRSPDDISQQARPPTAWQSS